MFEKFYIWNPVTCSHENGKYVGSIIDDWVITFDEITETTKSTSMETVPTNFNEKKVTCKTKKLYTLLAFLALSLLEKCPNTEYLLVCIFLYSNWIWRFTE